MMNFLQHLAGRVLEPQASLRPRLASAFETPQAAARGEQEALAPTADEGEGVVSLPSLGRSPSPQALAAPPLVAPRPPSPTGAPTRADGEVTLPPSSSEPFEDLAATPAAGPPSPEGALPQAVVRRLSSLAEVARVFAPKVNVTAAVAPALATKVTVSRPHPSLPVRSPSVEPELSSNVNAPPSASPGELSAPLGAGRRSASRPASAARVLPRTAQLLAAPAQLVVAPAHSAFGVAAVGATPRFAPARALEAPPEPVVNITIGRVEIKSAAPSPIPSPPRGAQRPQLALGDYLAERGKAGR